MSKLRVAAGLMMNVETTAFESPKYLPGLQNGQTRTHLGCYCDPQLLGVGVTLVRNWLARFQQALNVANNCVSRHFESFLLVTAKGNKAGKKRN